VGRLPIAGRHHRTQTGVAIGSSEPVIFHGRNLPGCMVVRTKLSTCPRYQPCINQTRRTGTACRIPATCILPLEMQNYRRSCRNYNRRVNHGRISRRHRNWRRVFLSIRHCHQCGRRFVCRGCREQSDPDRPALANRESSGSGTRQEIPGSPLGRENGRQPDRVEDSRGRSSKGCLTRFCAGRPRNEPHGKGGGLVEARTRSSRTSTWPPRRLVQVAPPFLVGDILSVHIVQLIHRDDADGPGTGGPIRQHHRPNDSVEVVLISERTSTRVTTAHGDFSVRSVKVARGRSVLSPSKPGSPIITASPTNIAC
jgi:hypothetical protein